MIFKTNEKILNQFFIRGEIKIGSFSGNRKIFGQFELKICFHRIPSFKLKVRYIDLFYYDSEKIRIIVFESHKKP